MQHIQKALKVFLFIANFSFVVSLEMPNAWASRIENNVYVNLGAQSQSLFYFDELNVPCDTVLSDDATAYFFTRNRAVYTPYYRGLYPLVSATVGGYATSTQDYVLAQGRGGGPTVADYLVYDFHGGSSVCRYDLTEIKTNLVGEVHSIVIDLGEHGVYQYDLSYIASTTDWVLDATYHDDGVSDFSCGNHTVKDADDNIYNTVQVREQCWMKENMRVGTMVQGGEEQSDNGVIEKYCYNNDLANCATDGGLYQWDEAMRYSTTEGAQGICPEGWHVPTDGEQYTLENYLKNSGASCSPTRSGTGCAGAGTAMIDGPSGLSFPFSGYRTGISNPHFISREAYTYVWSSTSDGYTAWSRGLGIGEDSVNRNYGVTDGHFGFSVRCLKDSSGTPAQNNPPKITLNGEATMELNVGDTFTDLGAMASDTEDGDLTDEIKIDGFVDTAKAETYTITYSVEDSGGLTASVERTVAVEANQAPTLSFEGLENGFEDGVEPNRGYPNTKRNFRVVYTDPQGQPPQGVIYLHVINDPLLIPPLSNPIYPHPSPFPDLPDPIDAGLYPMSSVIPEGLLTSDDWKNGVTFQVSGVVAKGDYLLKFEIGQPGTNDVPKLVAPNLLQKIEMKSGYDNVAFLPGIYGSHLKSTDDVVYWPPNLTDLDMSDDGESKRTDIYTSGIVKYVTEPLPLLPIYGPFAEHMDSEQSKGTFVWKPLPYDWRLKFEQVIENGTQQGERISYASSDIPEKPYILESLKELAETSRTGNVTIVAHSTGGLLAKYLLQRLKECNGVTSQNATNSVCDYSGILGKVGKVVFVGVPHLGTPKAVSVMLHSDGGPLVKTNVADLRELALYMPSAYTLLPSRAYTENVHDSSSEESGTKLITFNKSGLQSIDYPSDEYAKQFVEKYNTEIKDYRIFQSFLAGIEISNLDVPESVNYVDTRPQAGEDDYAHPYKLDTDMLVYADRIHNGKHILDNGLYAGIENGIDGDTWKPESTEIFQLVGYGRDTIYSVDYSLKRGGKGRGFGNSETRLGRFYRTTPRGDETVVLPSAAWIPENIASTYYLDLSKERLDTTHSKLLNNDSVYSIVDNIVFGRDVPLSDSVKREAPNNISRLHLAVFSPVTLGAIDEDGKFTGLRKKIENGQISTEIQQEIPGCEYYEIGEGKYLSLVPGRKYRVVIDGLDEGSFTFISQETNDEAVVNETVYSGIPTAEDLKARMEIGLGFDKGEFKIDTDGNGSVDFSLPSDESFDDVAAPTTILSISGTSGNESWYRSDVSVSLAAVDNEGGVGVRETKYSLDNGATWNTYTDPFTIADEGTHTVQFYSEDWFGNVEETKTSEIKIDKTVPEAEVGASLDEVGIEVSGKDNLTDVTVTEESATKYILSDEAGNKTTLELEGEKIRKGKGHHDNRVKKWYQKFDSWRHFFDWMGFGRETESRASAQLKTLQYRDEAVIRFPKNRMDFKWRTLKDETTVLVDQNLEVFGVSRIDGRYDAKKDETNIWIHEKGRPKRETVSGLRMLRFETARGALQYEY